MAFDEVLAERIRAALSRVDAVTERKMFGGIAFMCSGNMAVGVIGAEMMVRVGAEAHDEALARPHVRIMDFSNRPMRGFVYVEADGVATEEDLAEWVAAGVSFAESLSPK